MDEEQEYRLFAEALRAMAQGEHSFVLEMSPEQAWFLMSAVQLVMRDERIDEASELHQFWAEFVTLCVDYFDRFSPFLGTVARKGMSEVHDV